MRLFLMVLCIGLLAGCATLTKGTTQLVIVETPGVPGAKCTLTSSAIGTQTVVTPGTINLQKGSDNISVRCSKACYHDGLGTIASNLEGMTAGNIVVGGVIGLGVDAATGAMNKYSPEIQIAMTRNPNCGAPTAPSK